MIKIPTTERNFYIAGATISTLGFFFFLYFYQHEILRIACAIISLGCVFNLALMPSSENTKPR